MTPARANTSRVTDSKDAMRVVVTGGAGFIGSNLVHLLVRERPAWQIVVIDKLTYAGNPANLEPLLSQGRITFHKKDICESDIADALRGCDAVMHLAAETHVDRSLEDANAFIRTNVEGTRNLLQSAERTGVKRFLHVSTDEVYGSIAEGRFTETSPLAPTSPYARSKADADVIALEFARASSMDVVISRCSNNYGPFQFPEKFIPLMIAQAMAGEPLPVYGDGLNVRDWIHVEDHGRALVALLERGRRGEIYNVGGDSERTNLEIVRFILDRLDRAESLIHFVADRPGHDRRYAMDASRLKAELGWQCNWNFTRGLSTTIGWYRNHEEWLEQARSGAYRDYFARHYTNREQTVKGFSRSS